MCTLYNIHITVFILSNAFLFFFSLRTGSNTGFEVFIQGNGNIVVAALTRREYLTSSVASSTLLDGQWHYVTVAITPPKRPFSYSQINVYIDFMQKISATLKVQAINEVQSQFIIMLNKLHELIIK